MRPCGYFDHTVWEDQYLWSNVLYNVNNLVYIKIFYVLEIEFRFCQCFNIVILKYFCIVFKISRQNSFI